MRNGSVTDPVKVAFQGVVAGQKRNTVLEASGAFPEIVKNFKISR
jgi:hypothetical protein